jgi:flagellar basal-body rod protein FlgC
MSVDRIMNIAGSAMNAQMVRLNTTASNLANSSVLATTPGEAYRAKKPVFSTILEAQMGQQEQAVGGVRITEIVDDGKEVKQMYDPGNPLADEAGYVWGSNVNTVEEMIEMLDASRNYQNNVEVISTVKDLMLRTLEITKA